MRSRKKGEAGGCSIARVNRLRSFCGRMTLVLYRKRTARRFRLASSSGVRFRYSRQKEAARGCGGRGVLWEFNRFLPEKPCQTGSLAKRLLLMLIDVQLLAAIHVILPPAPSIFQESSDAGVYTRGSVRRVSGFVLTGNPTIVPRTPAFRATVPGR